MSIYIFSLITIDQIPVSSLMLLKPNEYSITLTVFDQHNKKFEDGSCFAMLD